MKVENIKIPARQVSELCQRWHIDKLSLFGSILRDDFRAGSDIDVLAEFQPGYTPSFFKLHQIQEEISELFDGRAIDLVTPKFLNHRIRDRILSQLETCYVAER